MVVGTEGRTEVSFVGDVSIDVEVLDRLEIVPITADGEGSIIPELETSKDDESFVELV